MFLGYLEVLGVACCAFVERQYVGETIRRSPWSSYFMLCFCLLISSATSNIALGYINYPTKVVFRSCKVKKLFGALELFAIVIIIIRNHFSAELA